MVTNNSINLNSQGIAYYDGTGTFSGVDGGTANFVLTSNGTGVAPSFQVNTEISTIDGDSGSATPSSGIITITGSSTGLTTTASGSTVGLTGTLSIPNGGTGVTSVTTAPTATAFAGWDANSNLSSNNFIDSYTSTVTSAGTTTLTVSSTQMQAFTGSNTQTIVLPNPNTLQLGQTFTIYNDQTVAGNILTINSSGGNLVNLCYPNGYVSLTCIASSGTTAAAWNVSQQSNYTTFQSTSVSVGSSGASFNIASLTSPNGRVILSGTLNVQVSGSITSMSLAINTTNGSVTGNFGVNLLTYTATGSFINLSIPEYVLPTASIVYYLNASVTYTGTVSQSGAWFSAVGF